jgi:hypothetical protein
MAQYVRGEAGRLSKQPVARLLTGEVSFGVPQLLRSSQAVGA